MPTRWCSYLVSTPAHARDVAREGAEGRRRCQHVRVRSSGRRSEWRLRRFAWLRRPLWCLSARPSAVVRRSIIRSSWRSCGAVEGPEESAPGAQAGPPSGVLQYCSTAHPKNLVITMPIVRRSAGGGRLSTPLHQLVVARHRATFTKVASEAGGLPRFVSDSFDRFLRCGILAHGFARFGWPGLWQRPCDFWHTRDAF